MHSEYFAYADDGYLTQVHIAENLVTLGTGSGQSTGTQVLRGVDTRDAMGRVTQHSEEYVDRIHIADHCVRDMFPS